MTDKSLWVVVTFLLIPGIILAGSVPSEDCITGTLDASDSHAEATLCVTTVQEAAPANGWRWGSEFGPPRLRPISLTVTIDGEEVFAPVSSFADLGNPRHVKLSATDDRIEVVVMGGDGAVAYTARMQIVGQFVRERTVTNDEFRGVSTERSVYGYNEFSQ